MTKTVTKKQLLAAACSSDQEEMIRQYWPWWWTGEILLSDVIKRARKMSIPYKTILQMIRAVDFNGWAEMWTALPGSEATSLEEQVALYFKQEEDKVVEEEEARAGRVIYEPLRHWGEIMGPKKTKYEARAARRPFVPKHWWEQPFAKMLIEKGLYPFNPFPHLSPTEYQREMLKEWSLFGKKEDEIETEIGLMAAGFIPSYWWEEPSCPSISPEDYQRLHKRIWQGRTEEFRQTITTGNQETNIMSVTKVFTKKQLMDTVCDDRYNKVIETFWPPGEAELAIRQIVTIARAIPNRPFYGVDDERIGWLIKRRLDPEGWKEAIDYPILDRSSVGLVNRYLKWDEKRILEGLRPTIEEAMKRPETRAPGDFQGVKIAPAPESLLFELGEFPFPKWPGNPPQPAPGSSIPEQYGRAVDAEIREGTVGVDFGQTWSPRSLTYEKLMKAMAELEETRKELLREQIRREGEQSAPADITLKETVALIEKYKKQPKSLRLPYLRLFGDGSGTLEGGFGKNVEACFHFDGIEELEKKLRELTALPEPDYHSLFYIIGSRLCANFSEIELTEENCLSISLAKWEVRVEEMLRTERIIVGEEEQTCACCVVYLRGENCGGCAIGEANQSGGCKGTPCEDFIKAAHKGDFDEALRAARAECSLITGLIVRRRGL